MSIAFVLLGCTLFVTTACAAELSVCIGVLGWGWPISSNAILCGTEDRDLSLAGTHSTSLPARLEDLTFPKNRKRRITTRVRSPDLRICGT